MNPTYGGIGPLDKMLKAVRMGEVEQCDVRRLRVAPALADRFTVVRADLRGYGDSAAPTSDATQEQYSKRAMAADLPEVMRRLGYQSFALVGHDRGARVARRLALDHPDSVARLALLDVVPTATIYGTLDQARATTVWRSYFLIQPSDLPERLIQADPSFYSHWTFPEWSGTAGVPSPAALAEYERCFDQATIHASCEDYRAGDHRPEHDQADTVHTIDCPLLVLWSASGIGASHDVLDVWRAQGRDVRGRPLDCGHFLPEERPHEVIAELRTFLAQ